MSMTMCRIQWTMWETSSLIAFSSVNLDRKVFSSFFACVVEDARAVQADRSRSRVTRLLVFILFRVQPPGYWLFTGITQNQIISTRDQRSEVRPPAAHAVTLSSYGSQEAKLMVEVVFFCNIHRWLWSLHLILKIILDYIIISYVSKNSWRILYPKRNHACLHVRKIVRPGSKTILDGFYENDSWNKKYVQNANLKSQLSVESFFFCSAKKKIWKESTGGHDMKFIVIPSSVLMTSLILLGQDYSDTSPDYSL